MDSELLGMVAPLYWTCRGSRRQCGRNFHAAIPRLTVVTAGNGIWQAGPNNCSATPQQNAATTPQMGCGGKTYRAEEFLRPKAFLTSWPTGAPDGTSAGPAATYYASNRSLNRLTLRASCRATVVSTGRENRIERRLILAGVGRRRQAGLLSQVPKLAVLHKSRSFVHGASLG